MSCLPHDAEGAAQPRRPPLRPTLFLVAALCFFLPFGTVSCGGEAVTVTGIELATKTVPGVGEDPDVGGPNLARQVEDEGFVEALLALLAAIGGLVLSIWRPRASGKALLLALAGIAALVSLPATAVAELADFSLDVGYVCALALEVSLVIVYVRALLRRRRLRRRTAGVVPPGALPPL